MKFLDRLDRIVRPVAIPNVTTVLVALQFAFWIGSMLDPGMTDRVVLVWTAVLQGEVWRLVSFLLVAPAGNPIFALFYFYIFYMMGQFLEQTWGTLRLNSFLYLGTVLTVAAAALVPGRPVTAVYLELTVFLAFATINPEFQFLLFFVLPVKVKYLAWLQGAFYLYTVIVGSIPDKLAVIASLGNYIIFFAPTLFSRARNFHRRLEWKAKTASSSSKPTHVCTVCGVDSTIDPRMDFRYCSKCDGLHAYCRDHLRDHVHIKED